MSEILNVKFLNAKFLNDKVPSPLAPVTDRPNRGILNDDYKYLCLRPPPIQKSQSFHWALTFSFLMLRFRGGGCFQKSFILKRPVSTEDGISKQSECLFGSEQTETCITRVRNTHLHRSAGPRPGRPEADFGVAFGDLFLPN